jgi:DNA-binding response OmpR family regulator
MENILVVDDDQELRETLIEVLSQEGLTVQAAASADQALALLECAPFHLLLLDMVMPGTDGMTAIPLLKKQAPRARIIVMTAFASVQNAVQALQQGADDYIVKPFKIDALMLAVRRNLQEARFLEGGAVVDLDGVFQGLANALRRQILLVLERQGKCRFMDLVRTLGVEDHTKVNFHLKVLREAGFIRQEPDKTYALTATGSRAASCLTFISRNLTPGR